MGHAGTLDPMATGLLLVGIGRATKLLTFLVGCDKTYTATVRLGQNTVTDDADGDVTDAPGAPHVDPIALESAVARLTGDIDQVPSSVSAIKIDGVRSYARVRGGEEVALPVRPVRVARFDVRAQRAELVDGLAVLDLDVEVQVSSGTYVRALARDLGADLGVGGHLTALRRTTVGRFDVAVAETLQDLTRLGEEGAALPVLPLAQSAREQFAVRELTAEQERDLRHGKRIEHDGVRQEPVAGIGPAGDLVAILDESGTCTRSQVVFPPFEQVP